MPAPPITPTTESPENPDRHARSADRGGIRRPFGCQEPSDITVVPLRRPAEGDRWIRAKAGVPPSPGTEQVARFLEIADLIADLEARRLTGRPGYPIRTMVGMALVGRATPADVKPHGSPGRRAPLSQSVKLPRLSLLRAPGSWEHKGALDSCIAAALSSMRSELPDVGSTIAIDRSDLPACANGQRFMSTTAPSARSSGS